LTRGEWSHGGNGIKGPKLEVDVKLENVIGGASVDEDFVRGVVVTGGWVGVG